jgi:hypothetical protein
MKAEQRAGRSKRDLVLESAASTVELQSAADWECDTREVANMARLRCVAAAPLANNATSALVLGVTPLRTLPRTLMTVEGTVDSSGQDRDPANNGAKVTTRVTGQPEG